MAPQERGGDGAPVMPPIHLDRATRAWMRRKYASLPPDVLRGLSDFLERHKTRGGAATWDADSYAYMRALLDDEIKKTQTKMKMELN
jgi:hypothetical protein